jgi:hypothetical protein
MHGSSIWGCSATLVPVLAPLFRRLFLDMLIAAHKADRLKFFSDHVLLAYFKTFAAWISQPREIDRYGSMPSLPSVDPSRCWPTCRALRMV